MVLHRSNSIRIFDVTVFEMSRASGLVQRCRPCNFPPVGRLIDAARAVWYSRPLRLAAHAWTVEGPGPRSPSLECTAPLCRPVCVPPLLLCVASACVEGGRVPRAARCVALQVERPCLHVAVGLYAQPPYPQQACVL